MKITITGSVPSKKNSRLILYMHGKPISIPGNNYQKWHKQASKQIYLYKPQINASNISITIFPADKRKADLTNKAESIMDLLVDTKIIEDDNWFIINNINLKFGGVDTKNPRAEIEIS